MLRRLIILSISIMAILAAFAKDEAMPIPVGDPTVASYYKGYNWRVDEEGDSVIVYYMVDLCVFPDLKFKNDKERQEYNRLVRNVKLTLPYAKLIAETLIETYEYIQTLPTQKERDEYLKMMENEIVKQYKPTLKRFSRNQARLLVKLVQRETHQSSYNIVKAFLGTFRASFWQGFGKLFGVSLKGRYEPQSNKEDFTIERIAQQVELGIL